MKVTRLVVLVAALIVMAALLASTALAGAKTPEKKWDWDITDLTDSALIEP